MLQVHSGFPLASGSTFQDWPVEMFSIFPFPLSLSAVKHIKKGGYKKIGTSSMKLLLRHQADLSLLGNLEVLGGHLCQRVPGVQGLPKQIIPHVCTRMISENHHGWYLQHNTGSKFGVIIQKLIFARSKIVHPCIYHHSSIHASIHTFTYNN